MDLLDSRVICSAHMGQRSLVSTARRGARFPMSARNSVMMLSCLDPSLCDTKLSIASDLYRLPGTESLRCLTSLTALRLLNSFMYR